MTSESIPFDKGVDAEAPTKVRFGVLFFLGTLALLLYVDRVCIGQALKEIGKEFSLSKERMSWFLNAFTLAYLLFEVPTGHLGDKYGSRKVITRIVVWWSVFTALTGATFGLWSLIVVRFLFGAGEAGAFPNVAIVINKWFPLAHRGKVRGLITTLSLVGAAAGTILSAALIDAIGWRWTFAVFGSAGVVWAAAFFWWFRDFPRDHPAVNDAERRLIGSDDRPPTEPGHAEPHHAIPWRIVLASPNVWLLGTIMMVSATLFYMQFQWYPTYLKEARGLSEARSGFLTSWIMLGGAAGCLSGGALSDAVLRLNVGRRWSRRICGGGALVLSAASMFAARHSESADLSTLFNSTALFFLQVSIPTWWTVVAEISGRHGASMWGLMNSMGGFGVLLSTNLIGRIVGYRESLGLSKLDSWNPVFEGAAGLLLLGAVLWLLVDPTRSIVERRGTVEEVSP